MGSFPAHPPERFAQVEHLYTTTNLSHRAIGEQCGVAEATVGTWAHRYGWRRPGEDAPRTVRKPAAAKKQPTAAGSRRSVYLALIEIAEEARRQIAELRACPPHDLAERERHARTVATYVRTLRQSKELLAQVQAAGSRSAQSKGDPHDGERSLDQSRNPESGRSLAELRDEFVRLLSRAVALEPDR